LDQQEKYGGVTTGMPTQTISPFQMGVLLFVFLTGSSIIFVPGPLIGKAGTGAWMSLLLAGLIGCGITAMLLYLNRRFPGLDYVDYSRKLIGNVLTIFFGVLTISYLLEMQSAIVVGVGLFMTGAMMRDTPMYAFTLPVFVISALTARAGIEVMARMFTLIMLLTSFFVVSVFVLAIPDYQPEQLLPVLPKGWKPVLGGAFYTFGFPYSEIFLFGMLLPFAAGSSLKQLSRSMWLAISASLLALCAASLCVIMVLGANAAAEPFVLYTVACLIEFEEIIQRIESVIGISLILGSYMKTTISLFVLNMFLSRLCGLKDSKALIMPLALVGFLMGMVNLDSITQWSGIVTNVHPLWTALVLLLPLLTLTIVAMLRPGVK
jgi:spore germination protein KB